MMVATARTTISPLTAGRVLVVDDHRQARESMADVLRQAGHRVACCSSASRPCRSCSRRAYDCIVTDLKMPGMSGWSSSSSSNSAATARRW